MEWSVHDREPSVLADILARGGTSAGTRRPAATMPANAALATISSSQTARHRGNGESPSSRGTRVLDFSSVASVCGNQ